MMFNYSINPFSIFKIMGLFTITVLDFIKIYVWKNRRFFKANITMIVAAILSFRILS